MISMAYLPFVEPKRIELFTLSVQGKVATLEHVTPYSVVVSILHHLALDVNSVLPQRSEPRLPVKEPDALPLNCGSVFSFSLS